MKKIATDQHRQSPTMLNKKTPLLYEEDTREIIDLAIEVKKKMGLGFLEKVYENCLMKLFEREGIKAAQQVPISVKFDGMEVGNYVADIIVDEKIIVEIKSATQIVNAHIAQTLNYLKATDIRLGIILNFSKEDFSFKRVVL